MCVARSISKSRVGLAVKCEVESMVKSRVANSGRRAVQLCSMSGGV